MPAGWRDRYEALAARRIALLHGPTPLHPLSRLGERLGIDLHVKRDDLTGLAMGGNKARKLEFLLREALDAGADTLVTLGGIQSNHVRQTASAAAMLGLRCEVVLRETRYSAIGADRYARSGNVQLDRLLGAQLHIVGLDASAVARADEVMADLARAGKNPYLIPLGGSNACGALGYVGAALELAAQAGEPFDHLVVASGSGGTQAGLVAGIHLLGHPTIVHGIDVASDDTTAFQDLVGRLAGDVCALLGEAADPAISIDGRYLGAAYAVPSEASARALTLLARTEGLLLDPVYTAKGMAGLVGLVDEGRIRQGDRVVFVHTGGHPGLFAYEGSSA